MNRKKLYLSEVDSNDAIEPVYTHKGKVCPYLAPRGKEVKELESWALIRNDLNCALESFKYINHLDSNNGNETVMRSLFFAGIISYAKPFSEGRGRVIRLRKCDVFAHENELKRQHSELIKIRNKYIAHGDKSSFESVRICVALSPELESKGVVDIYHMAQSTVGLGSEEISSYVEVTEATLKFVSEKINDLNAFVMQEAKKLDINYLYENAYYHGISG